MSRHEADIRTTPTKAPTPIPASVEQLQLFSADAMRVVQKEEAQWRKEVLEPVLDKKPYWKKDFTTVSGMDVNPLATPASVAQQDFHEVA